MMAFFVLIDLKTVAKFVRNNQKITFASLIEEVGTEVA